MRTECVFFTFATAIIDVCVCIYVRERQWQNRQCIYAMYNEKSFSPATIDVCVCI